MSNLEINRIQFLFKLIFKLTRRVNATKIQKNLMLLPVPYFPIFYSHMYLNEHTLNVCFA